MHQELNYFSYECKVQSLDERLGTKWISIYDRKHQLYNYGYSQISLWRYDKRVGVSNHRRRHCLLNCLFRRRSKKHQSSASLAYVRGIHRSPVNSPHKWPVTRKMFPSDDVTMSGMSVMMSQIIENWMVCSTAFLAENNKNIKAPLYWFLVRRSCMWPVDIPDLQMDSTDKGQLCGEGFNTKTSSWNVYKYVKFIMGVFMSL